MSELRTQAIELRRSGLRNFVIAERLELKDYCVSRLLRDCGVPLPKWKYTIRASEVERTNTMVSLYRSGKTLQEIGDRYGICRERVRQIIGRLGLTRNKGGLHARSEMKAAERAARKDERALKRWGCSYAQYKYLLSLTPLHSKYKAPVRAFLQQRNNAKRRGIEWNLLLWDWWQIWQKSGRWSQRGRGQGYVMARRRDVGAYERGNVFITSAIDNCSNAPKKKKSGLPLGVYKDKNKRGFTASRMLCGKIHRLGSFPTPELAHSAYLTLSPVPTPGYSV